MSLKTSLEEIQESLEGVLQACNTALFPKGVLPVHRLSELPGAIGSIQTDIKFKVIEEYPGLSCGLSFGSVNEIINNNVQQPINNPIRQQYAGLNIGLSIGSITENILVTEGEQE